MPELKTYEVVKCPDKKKTILYRNNCIDCDFFGGITCINRKEKKINCEYKKENKNA
ncbi:MAG: hypothetical protein ACOCQA_02515 [bacterium]